MVFLLLIIFVSVVFGDGTTNSYCSLTEKIFNHSKQFVTQYGEPKNITVYWDRDLTRAAAALLAVTLRHAAGYQHVRLQQTLSNSAILTAKEFKDTNTFRKPFDEVRLIPFTSWTTTKEEKKKIWNKKYECLTKSTALTHQKLYIHMKENFRQNEQCKNYGIEEFYSDTTKLKNCGFDTTSSGILNIYYLDPNKKTTAENFASLLKATLQSVSHAKIFQMIRSNKSLLFVDYDMWDGNPDVTKLELKVPDTSYVEKDIKVKCIAKEFAPYVYEVASKFAPSLKSLRSILELESNGVDIEEATCEWVLQNRDGIQQTIYATLNNIKVRVNYDIGVFYCEETETTIKPFIQVLGNLLNQHNLMIETLLPYVIENCSDPVSMTKYVFDVTNKVTPSFIGVVLGGIKNQTMIKDLDSIGLPVLLYDTIDVDVDLTTSVWLTNGRLLHLALALQYFLNSTVGTEMTVLTESTPTAEQFNADLKNVSNIKIDIIEVPHNVSSFEAEHVFRKIRSKKSKIIVLNTNNDDAVSVMALAKKLKVSYDEGFTWIVREWKKPENHLTFKHFTFSFWYQNDNATSIYDLEQNVNNLAPNVKASMDAVVTLAKVFRNVVDKYPQARYDVRNKKVIKQFERSFKEMNPIEAGHQNLTFKSHSPEEVVVYLNEWYCGNRTTLAQLRVNTTSRSVQLKWGKLPVDSLSETVRFINRYGVWIIFAVSIVTITIVLTIIGVKKK